MTSYERKVGILRLIKRKAGFGEGPKGVGLNRWNYASIKLSIFNTGKFRLLQ